MDKNLVKVVINLHQDEGGYPSASSESLWAEDLGNRSYKIDNIPFFAPDISVDDVVRADEIGGERVVQDTVVRSGHSTLRVVLFAADQMGRVREGLLALGCKTELSHIPTLAAVDIPPDVPIQVVRGYLDRMASAGVLDYEESALRHLD